jgi:hypothetical protein
MDSGIMQVLGVSLLTSLPLIVVWIAGIVLSIVFMKKHKRVSLFALAVFILCLINMVLSLIASILPLTMRNSGIPVALIGSYLMVFRIIITFISLASWSLIIAAVFIDRNNLQVLSHTVPKKIRSKKE